MNSVCECKLCKEFYMNPLDEMYIGMANKLKKAYPEHLKPDQAKPEVEPFEKLVSDCVERVKHKPKSYHVVCSGGGSGQMVNTWQSEENYNCFYQGDKHWLTPMCEKCTGIKGYSSFTDSESSENRGVEMLARELLRKHKGE